MKKIVQKGISALAGAAAIAQAAAVTVSAAAITEIDPPTAFVSDIGVLFNNILTFVFIIAALLVFFYLIWGGIDWITSGGDKGQTEKARNKITAAIVGLIVLLASFAILQLVLRFFTGGSDLNQILDQNVNQRLN